MAGTLVATVNGLAAIETIKAGDYVLSTDPDTMKTEYKLVLETYIRKVDRLVHLIISGEEIITTVDHPFYVQGRGFIEAGNLLVGDKLVSSIGEDLLIENYNIEVTEEVVDNKFDAAVQEAGIPAEDVRGTLKNTLV
ncbi:MAG: HINT domain-containing protein [Ruminococcus flavefaciens]|nr:HINT domain-containing protein [Ruminococcus flavefaciens]MCM1361028.1 HINT domain-containing protein [Clostridiales bacterium]